VVVVGGRVVVVVGGEVVVVGEAEAPTEGSELMGGEVTGVGAFVVGVLVVGVLGVWTAGVLEAVAPGCSLATITPMTTVAPVAPKAAKRVRTRREAAARRRVSGEWDGREDFIGHFLASVRTYESIGESGRA
jgi:hypothetical protein